MSLLRTLLFSISLLLFTVSSTEAQTANANDDVVALDSISYNEKYGLRIGVDLAKPLRTLLDDDYSGFEIGADYRLFKRYDIAGEIGNEQFLFNETNLVAETKGSYVKVGANYNAYNNWIGMNNQLFAGLRYGFSSFSQELQSYTIYTDTPYFEPTVVQDPIEFNGLLANWLELQLGIKTELFNNLYLSIHVQLKRKFSEEQPENFDNLFIPGFGRTTDDSFFGVGYGYSISYLIPLYKKTEKQKNFSK